MCLYAADPEPQATSSSEGAGPDGPDGATFALESLFGVESRSALVTGGTRGIGRMISSALLANGAEVTVAARSEEQLEASVEELGAIGKCRGVLADVATEEGRAALVDAVGDGLDILVNNAGKAVPESPTGAEADRSAAMFATNVTAPLLLTQALLPALTNGATQADPARVVMVGSVDGIRVPVTPLFSYGASKAAVHSLTRHLAHSLAPEHVNVNAIAPGMFRGYPSHHCADQSPSRQSRVSRDRSTMRSNRWTDATGGEPEANAFFLPIGEGQVTAMRSTAVVDGWDEYVEFVMEQSSDEELAAMFVAHPDGMGIVGLAHTDGRTAFTVHRRVRRRPRRLSLSRRRRPRPRSRRGSPPGVPWRRSWSGRDDDRRAHRRRPR